MTPPIASSSFKTGMMTTHTSSLTSDDLDRNADRKTEFAGAPLIDGDSATADVSGPAAAVLADLGCDVGVAVLRQLVEPLDRILPFCAT